jgi:hypothetical protein
LRERADASKPNMGLTAWKGEVVRKGDVTVAKNYLAPEEMTALNRIVTMYLDFAEDQAKRRRQISQKDWRAKLDSFLQLNDRDVLANAGSVTKEVADKLAREQYDSFHASRLTASDEQAEFEHEAELRAIETLVGDSVEE